MSRSSRLGVASLVALACCACTPALREPPTLGELAPGEERVAAQALLREAGALWARRDLATVRRAAELWTRAGAGHAEVAGWTGAARARVWLADHEPGAEQRRASAISAVHAAQWCQRVAPAETACDYWLALALGVQARERRSTGVDALRQMVRLLEGVIERDPLLEHAGPHRVLALVLARAPGWPTGPGDPERALDQAREAVRLDAAYPPNQLCLAETLAAVDDVAGSREAYRRAAELAARWVADGRVEGAEWRAEAERAQSAAGR